MQPIKSSNSTHYLGPIRPNISRVPLRSFEPLTDSPPPPDNIPKGKATVFPDPGDPHRFLVPPHDNRQLDLEMDSERRSLKDLTLQGSKGYQDVADLFPDPIYAEDPVEGVRRPLLAQVGADFAASEPAPFPSGTDPRHLGLRGGASAEYLSTLGGDGCEDSLLDGSTALSTPWEAATDPLPKGEGPDEASAPTTREGEMVDLLTANIAWGVLAQQVASTFGISVIAAVGFYVGNVLCQLANAKIKDWLAKSSRK